MIRLSLWFSPLGVVRCYGRILMVDRYSFGLVSLTILISRLSVLASGRDIYKSSNRSVRFIIRVLVLTLALIFCFSLSSLLNFYIMFEFSLIPILLIILG